MKINLHDLTHTIARAAPLLGSALAGPGGAVIGSMIASKFGGDVQAPEALHALITQDPEADLKLKAMEAEHKIALKRLQLETASFKVREQTQDRINARQREVLISQIPAQARDHTPAILAYVLTFGLIGIVGKLLCWPMPASSTPVVLGLLSSFATVWVGAMGYYHGSSMGSRVKESSLIHHLHQGAAMKDTDDV